MAIDLHERFLEASQTNEECFSKLEAILDAVERFELLTSGQLLKKIKGMCEEGLEYDTPSKQEVQLYSIYLALETYFTLRI